MFGAMLVLGVVGASFAPSRVLASCSKDEEEDCEPGTEDMPGTTINEPVQNRGVTQNLNRIWRNLNSNAFRGGPPGGTGQDNQSFFDRRAFGTGVAGGDGPIEAPWGVWASGSFTRFSDTNVATESHSDSIVGTLGADYQFLPWALVGLSLSYESTDTDTTFNQGNVDTTGIAIAPYFSFSPYSFLTFDVSVGYALLETDQDRILPGTATQVTADNVGGDRLFGAIGANVFRWIGNWALSGRAGVTATRTRTDAFTESNGTFNAENANSLTQFNLSATAMYYFGLANPYVTLGFDYDLHNEFPATSPGVEEVNEDPTEVLVEGGVNFYITQMVSAGVSASTILMRNNFDSVTASGNVRVQF